MKIIKILLSLGLSFGLAGCIGDEVKDFIPGTYANSAGGEFSIASDTLVLEHVEGNNYLVHRRTGYHLISEGKLGPREYETEEWSAVYDPVKKLLLESKKGKILSFYPDRKAMQVGKRVYEKMN